jgi:hypothetical protein
VDNQIFELIQNLSPHPEQIDWDIEMIGGIRDTIQDQLMDKQKIMNKGQFYP